MRSKWIILILVIAVLGISGYCYYLYNKFPKGTNSESINKVQRIEVKVDTMYVRIDSLLTHVKESESVVKRVESEYKSNYIRIITESTTEDYEFFTKYLESQRNRGLFNFNYSDSAKAN